MAFQALPADEQRRLPRYPVPVAHLGRLAVDRSAQGQGLGAKLLVAALEMSLDASSKLAIYAVEVIAKNEAARRFYARYGFASLQDDRLHMYLSLRAIRRAFEM